MKKRLIGISVFLLVAALWVCWAGAVVKPTDEFYVNDYAEVLSPATRQHIMSKSPSLYKQTGAQIVVLTVKSLEGLSVEEYALTVGREWGIGGKEKNNGLLILLATEDRKIRVEVGYGLEGALNDAKAGRLLDNYALPHLQNNEFDEGIRKLYDAVLSVVMQEYGLEALPGYEDARDIAEGESGLAVIPFILIIIVFIFALSRSRSIWPWVFLGGPRGPRNTRGGGFGGSSGGFGGGGFSGGGGSFGGGGASRGF